MVTFRTLLLVYLTFGLVVVCAHARYHHHHHKHHRHSSHHASHISMPPSLSPEASSVPSPPLEASSGPSLPPEDSSGPCPSPEDSSGPCSPPEDDSPQSPPPEASSAPSPPPEASSAPSPPPKASSAPSPSRNASSAPSPPPEDSSAPSPPPKDSSAPSPPRNASSAPSPTPEDSSAPSPPPKASPAPSPPPEASSTPSPPPEVSSTPSPPPETSSAPSPPHNASSAPSPPPEASSTPSPPPEASSTPSPPPETSSAPSPPHNASSAPSPPPEASSVPSPPPDASAPSPDVNWDNSTGGYDVRKFGAVGDGETDDTEAFKTAWDTACSQNDSGVLLVPYGFTFMIQSTIFTGPCQSSLVFQLDGTIVPPDGPESWPKNNSRRQWLVFYRMEEMTVQGEGIIDGRGEGWWDLPCKPHKIANGTILRAPCDSPVAIRFFMSNNLTVQGIKIRNSPQFHFRFDNCKNVHIESISITAPALSPNTDGIHIENANNVRIYNSVISNGDDCVSIGSGCYNVDIKNITCGLGHGISIGSLGNHNSRACDHNITVRDSVIRNSANGVRIKTWQGGSGAVSGVTFDNIHMDNVRNPIMIDQYYCLTKDCANRTSAVYISDIQYTGIKGTYDIRSPPMHLACSDSLPCTNITFSDIELLPAQGEIMSDPFCWNAYGQLQTLTIPPVSCLLEGVPRSLLENDIGFC